MKRARVNNSL